MCFQVIQSFTFSDFPCLDVHPHCPMILELNPSACDFNDENPYYDFMRIACMKTCNICGDVVSRCAVFTLICQWCLFHFQGCRDEFSQCKYWAANGVCSKFPSEMVFICRESCGSCGYRASRFINFTTWLNQNAFRFIINFHNFVARELRSQIHDGKDFSNMKSPNFCKLLI